MVFPRKEHPLKAPDMAATNHFPETMLAPLYVSSFTVTHISSKVKILQQVSA